MPHIDPGPTQPMDPFSQKRSSSPSHGQQPPRRQSPPSSRQAPPPPPQQPSRSPKVDIRLAAQTDVGRQRTQNEDWVKTLTIPHFFNQGTAYICIVADGVGGEAGGEHASYTVVSILQEWLLAAQNAPPEDIPHYLSQAILAANQRLLEDMVQRPELEGMGSTVVVGLILGDRLYVAHVGDSRAYLVRNGHIYQLTVDHSWGQQALETGYLSPQEVTMHPNRNVLKRFLGTDEPLQVDTDIIEPGTFDPTKPQQWRRLPFLTLQPNDRLL
ncbi:MAG: serine/threonine-protein phosphatase, partial [Ardenticatenia bacterium]